MFDWLKWLGDHAPGIGVIVAIAGGGVLAYLKWLFPRQQSNAEPKLAEVSRSPAIAQLESAALSVGAGASISSPVVVGSNNAVQHVTNVAPTAYVPTLERRPSKPTAVNIRNAEASLTPYMQQQSAKDYIGLQVQWPCIFSSLEKVDPEWHEIMGRTEPLEKFLVVLKYGGLAGPDIVCRVYIEDCPKLKFLHPGDPVWAEGNIEAVKSSYIALQNVKLEFE